MTKRLASNSITNIIDFAIALAITFMLTPIYLKSLGQHDYGIWELVNIFIGYASVLDLGMRYAVTRQTAYFIAKNKISELSPLYSTAMIYLAMIGFLIAFVCLLVGLITPETLSQTGAYEDKYQLFLFLIAGLVIVNYLRQATEGVIAGRQLHSHQNLVNIIVKVCVAFVIYNYLTPDNGLTFMVVVYLIATGVRFVFYNLILIIYKPSLFFIAIPKMSYLKELIIYGSKSSLAGIAYVVETSAGAVMIGSMLGPAIVPVYLIPKNLLNYISGFLKSATAPILPFFTNLTNNINRLCDLFYTFSKLCVWYVWTAIVFVWFYGPEFIYLWLGDSIDQEPMRNLVFLFASVIFVERLNPLGHTVAFALNKHGFYAKWQTVSAILTIATTFIGINLLGLTGTVWALLLTRFLFILLYGNYTARILNTNITIYIRKIIIPNLIVLTPVAFLTYWWKYLMFPTFYDYGDLVFGFLLVSFCSLFFKALSITKEEKLLLRTLFKKV